MTFRAEIVAGDPLFSLIRDLVVEHKPKTILEIGSANGLGSTQAFLAGTAEAGHKCKLVCLEANSERFADLKKNVAGLPFVTCINACSVPVDRMMDEAAIDEFMARGYKYNINRYYPRETVKTWLSSELEMITTSGIPQNGIELALKKTRGKPFDMVLVDGSAFTGREDTRLVMGAGVIVMDDTMDIKCHDAVADVMESGQYQMVADNREARNGFAAFIREGGV
jgi:hypothetical protein